MTGKVFRLGSPMNYSKLAVFKSSIASGGVPSALAAFNVCCNFRNNHSQLLRLTPEALRAYIVSKEALC